MVLNRQREDKDIYPGVVFYCFITNYHKLNGLKKKTNLLAHSSVNQKSGYGMAGFPAGGITEINALARLRSLAGEVQNSTSNLIQVGRIQFLAAVGVRAASPC